MTINDVQGGYPTDQAAGYAGMPASANARDGFSYQVEAGAMGFGLAVTQGTQDRSAVVGGTGAFLGVSIANKAGTVDEYAVGSTASVLNKGVIFVAAVNAVTPADTVTFDASGGLGKGLAIAAPQARFLDTAAAGALVRVHLS